MTTEEQPTWEQQELKRSSRDLAHLRAELQVALATHLADGSDPHVGELEATSANGMSSETLLFDVSWRQAGEAHTARLVARVAPDTKDVPVFPRYDLVGQFRTIGTVAARSDVPVPELWWCEPGYFVMGRIDGEVPPDVMPYNFGDSWLFHATSEQQSALQEASIGLLARLHDIPRHHFDHLPDATLREHVAGRRAWYEWAAADCGRSPLVEKGFTWLADHWPRHESGAVFNWGDSRIGNVMYRDFQPVGVLDWEMAAVGSPELDLAWMIYVHRMFEDLAQQYGFPGMPAFLRPEDAATTYERMTGHSPRDLEWYLTYSCLQLAIVFLRTGWRQVRFGEREAPDDPDELLTNAATLAALIS